MSLIGPASRSKLYTLTFTHNKLSLAQDRANLAFFCPNISSEFISNLTAYFLSALLYSILSV